MASSEFTTFDSATEAWRDIPGYEGLYQASSYGRVRSLRRRGLILSPKTSHDGYLGVNLIRDCQSRSYKVHVLIALTFLGQRPLNHQVNHLDGDKTNNAVHNLEYCTIGDNHRHAYRTGLRSGIGEKNPKARLTAEQVLEIRALRADGESLKDLASRFGVALGHISAIVHRKTWKHI